MSTITTFSREQGMVSTCPSCNTAFKSGDRILSHLSKTANDVDEISVYHITCANKLESNSSITSENRAIVRYFLGNERNRTYRLSMNITTLAQKLILGIAAISIGIQQKSALWIISAILGCGLSTWTNVQQIRTLYNKTVTEDSEF